MLQLHCWIGHGKSEAFPTKAKVCFVKKLNLFLETTFIAPLLSTFFSAPRKIIAISIMQMKANLNIFNMTSQKNNYNFVRRIEK